MLRVDPNCAMDTVRAAPWRASALIPGPSWPNTSRQSRGSAVMVMQPGDTVYTPPGEWHWHGAAPDHFMTHLAMWEAPDPDSGRAETTWGEHVTDDEYGYPEN